MGELENGTGIDNSPPWISGGCLVDDGHVRQVVRRGVGVAGRQAVADRFLKELFCNMRGRERLRQRVKFAPLYRMTLRAKLSLVTAGSGRKYDGSDGPYELNGG